MLHELLLALSGHPSPLLQDKEHEITALLHPSEKAVLKQVAGLGYLHDSIRSRCKVISSSHPSTICRAVCSSIISVHLSSFQDKIVEVESGILRQDTAYVGAYDIVPLSAIVGSFDGWHRPLRWLHGVTTFIEQGAGDGSPPTASFRSGSQLIDHLRTQTHTGHPDIEEIALALVEVAEASWLRQLSTWLLYGQCPSYGREDFLIQQCEGRSGFEGNNDFELQETFAPDFVTSSTARSILFIGRSLQHIHRAASRFSAESASELESVQSKILPEHSSLLRSLKHPISNFILTDVVVQMRSSMSRNALQRLLPTTEIVKVLYVLRDFFLLERCGFAAALVAAADECLAGRHIKAGDAKDKTRLVGMLIKEGEINTVLSRTWASLTALHDLNNEDDDEVLELGRELIALSIRNHEGSNDPSHVVIQSSRQEDTQSVFSDVLLALPTVLSIAVRPPLDLFLSAHDMAAYSSIHAYLISIRRVQIHSADLWKLSTLRRNHPASQTPTSGHQEELVEIRLKANERAQIMRRTWSVVAHITYFFTQLSEYLQGEIISASTAALHMWLESDKSTSSTMSQQTSELATRVRNPQSLPTRPGSELRNNGPGSTLSSADLLASNEAETWPEPHREQLLGSNQSSNYDPETVAATHRTYLEHLEQSLLLTDSRYATGLRNLMTRADHIIALMQRLATVVQILQLEEQAQTKGPNDSRHAKEEADLMKSLKAAGRNILSSLADVIQRLREMDEERRYGTVDVFRAPRLVARRPGRTRDGSSESPHVLSFVPWRGGGIARLLMRIDPGVSSAYE